MIINKSGIVIRIGVADLRVMGRATQGVRLITFKGKDSIASVAKVPREEIIAEEDLEENEDPSAAENDVEDNSGTETDNTEADKE